MGFTTQSPSRSITLPSTLDIATHSPTISSSLNTSFSPTLDPSQYPTLAPSLSPTSSRPTFVPSSFPTMVPTLPDIEIAVVARNFTKPLANYTQTEQESLKDGYLTAIMNSKRRYSRTTSFGDEISRNDVDEIL